jgi:hypothetical protein
VVDATGKLLMLGLMRVASRGIFFDSPAIDGLSQAERPADAFFEDFEGIAAILERHFAER